jgi:hypothetical protein
VRDWADRAIADAERRGLPELRPLLENLAEALAVLRRADWNDDASGAKDPDSGQSA